MPSCWTLSTTFLWTPDRSLWVSDAPFLPIIHGRGWHQLPTAPRAAPALPATSSPSTQSVLVLVAGRQHSLSPHPSPGVGQLSHLFLRGHGSHHKYLDYSRMSSIWQFLFNSSAICISLCVLDLLVAVTIAKNTSAFCLYSLYVSPGHNSN